MDGLTLLSEARGAGLKVTDRGGLLVVKGPKRAGELARRLLASKPAVLSALALESFKIMVDRAKKHGPTTGPYHDALVRVLGDYWLVAMTYYRDGVFLGHVEALKVCIQEAVDNANETGKIIGK